MLTNNITATRGNSDMPHITIPMLKKQKYGITAQHKFRSATLTPSAFLLLNLVVSDYLRWRQNSSKHFIIWVVKGIA